MAFNDLVRSGVAIANRLTASLQDAVSHEPWIGSDGQSKPLFGPAVSRPALVEMVTRRYTTSSGEVVSQRAAVTFLEPVEPNGATGRVEPIDPRDRITLPDGTVSPILDASGMVDPGTGAPYLHQVALGGGLI